jgi:phosphopantetheinyl transferase (holo-ACP synthase)
MNPQDIIYIKKIKNQNKKYKGKTTKRVREEKRKKKKQRINTREQTKKKQKQRGGCSIG